MSACEGCGISPKGQAQALQAALMNAKQYAINHGKTVAIYKEGFEYRFCEYETAVAGNYPIIQVVSKYHKSSAQ